MRPCPFCMEPIPASSRYCDICHTNLDQPFRAGRGGAGSGPAAKKDSGFLGLLVKIAAVCFVLFGLLVVAIAVPNFGKAKNEARKKHCFANQRVMLSALEMYAMDSPEPMRRFDYDRLNRGGYLKNEPKCPEPGTRYNVRFIPSKTSFDYQISCEGPKGHGSVPF